MTKSELGSLCVDFLPFLKYFWPLICVMISLPLNSKMGEKKLTYALILMRCVGIVMRKIFAMPLTQVRTLSTLNILKMNGWS